ncbi:hypothetical protein ACOME3_005752 [Neoechinorhynchus agilis]
MWNNHHHHHPVAQMAPSQVATSVTIINSGSNRTIGIKSNAAAAAAAITTTTTRTAFDYVDPTYVITMIIYILMIVITSVGNLTVIIAIGLVKKLKTPSNTLVMNLALSDFLVGTIVMPLALVNGAFGGKWILGPYLCDFWTTIDVLVCTASILNFLAISIDRYLIIAHPLTYARKRTFRLMLTFIVVVWILSLLISTSPMFGWGLPSSNLPYCIVNQSLSYQIFATLLSFYVPLSLVIILYVHIFRIADKTAKRERESLAGTYEAYFAINTAGSLKGALSSKWSRK